MHNESVLIDSWYWKTMLLNFLVTEKAAPHEGVIRTGLQSWKWGVILFESNIIIVP